MWQHYSFEFTPHINTENRERRNFSKTRNKALFVGLAIISKHTRKHTKIEKVYRKLLERRRSQELEIKNWNIFYSHFNPPLTSLNKRLGQKDSHLAPPRMLLDRIGDFQELQLFFHDSTVILFQSDFCWISTSLGRYCISIPCVFFGEVATWVFPYCKIWLKDSLKRVLRNIYCL